jgi:rubrerythrin
MASRRGRFASLYKNIKRKGEMKMAVKVDITKFERDTWENDWYTCPNCGFDSLDIYFEYCPSCGIKLEWPDGEEDE